MIRRTLMAFVVAAAVGAAPAQATTPGSFTGKVADDFILVGAHLGAQAADGSQSIRVYVCNSVPYTEWFTGTVSGGHAQLTSASGHASADVTVSEDAVTGTVRLRGGVVRRFAMHRARGGAGIYEITISRGQRFAGRSFAGDVFVGQERGRRVTATIVTADNRARSISGFNVMELSRRALRAVGLPTRYAGLGRRSDRPGRYIAVVTQVHGRLAFFGAEAAVIRGSKVSEIIGLDKMVQIGTVFTLAMPIALPPFPPLR